MIVHDSTFEDLAKAPVKQVDVVVARQFLDTYGYLDDGLTWTSSDLLMEVKIDIVGQVLGTVTKKATVRLLGIVDGFEVKNLFQVRLGLYDNDSSVPGFNYISEGFFLVDTIDYDYEAGSTTITMYDHMWTATKTPYTTALPENAVTYPITIEAFAEQVAAVLDINLMAGFDQLPNFDYEIAQDLYSLINGATVATAIRDIAGATGTTARITDTTLVFAPYEPLSENLTSSELKTLKIGDTYGPVTSVVLGRVPQNDNIAIVSTAPSANLVSGVDTGTNLITLTGHAMLDGNMIQITSTGTLPAPLVEGQEYYVFTNDEEDTFALAPTYNDGVAGTNLIDLTTTGTGDITIPTLPVREIQINNNEILDDDRQDLIAPLYNVLSGLDWTDVKADTVGLGWHEGGDVISFTQGSETFKAWLSEIHLVLAGSIKEQLVSIVPEVASINYAAAGGIISSIYNTEIKVDKQNQEIVSVVSRQDTLEGVVNENFTQINQDVDDVLITIQRAGGGNILYNSVGFAKETFRDADDIAYDKLLYWTYNDPYDIDDNGRATSYSSSESQSAGGISGQVVEMSGIDMSISQRVTIGAGVPLCFALRVKNIIGTGTATITLENDLDSWEIEIDDAQTYDWVEFKQENFQTSQPWLDVTIQIDNADKFAFTDLRLMYGSTTQGWVQANGEILSANVQFTTEGVRVFDSLHDTETRMTFNEFSTRRKSDNAILFEADDLGVITNNLSVKGRTSYIRDDETIIKQITVGSSNPKSGLAFIKVVES